MNRVTRLSPNLVFQRLFPGSPIDTPTPHSSA
uniref:Uncharacterized protein n=1 Tax=Anguilla anguilla TaxID=7936 RepID=A0A0E9UWX3_ANGAN